MVSPSLILILVFYYFILFIGDFDGSKIPCLCDVRVPANTCWERICRRFLFVLTKNLVTEANDSGKKKPLVTARANHQRAARLRSPRVKFQLKKTNLFKIPPAQILALPAVGTGSVCPCCDSNSLARPADSSPTRTSRVVALN